MNIDFKAQSLANYFRKFLFQCRLFDLPLKSRLKNINKTKIIFVFFFYSKTWVN